MLTGKEWRSQQTDPAKGVGDEVSCLQFCTSCCAYLTYSLVPASGDPCSRHITKLMYQSLETPMRI